MLIKNDKHQEDSTLEGRTNAKDGNFTVKSKVGREDAENEKGHGE